MYRYLSKDPTPLSRTLELDDAPRSTSLDAALFHVLDLAQDILDVPALLIWFIDPVNVPRLQAARGLDLDIFPCLSPFCSAVLSANEVLVVQDVQDEPTLSDDPVLASADARFCAGIPIQTAGEPIGGLGLLDPRPRTLTPRHLQTLQHLAHLAADAWILRDQGHAEREARYRAYFERSVAGIWCYDFVPPVPLSLPVAEQIRLANAQAHLTECNSAMARMYGFENAAQLAADDLTKRRSSYTAGNLEVVQAFIESGYRATTVETQEHDRHGAPRYFLKNVVGIVENEHLVRVWGAQADVTERRRAEEALRKSEQLLSSINQNISEGIYRYTPQGALLYANDALARLFGYASREELQHVQVPAWYRDPKRRDELALRAAREQGLQNEEAEFVRKDGSTFWGLINCNATLDAEGGIVTYDGAISDITQRKRYEQSLIEAKEQALEIAQLKSAFLANMSHEIRTPLTAVVGFADILADEVTGEHQEMAKLIQQSGQRLVQTLQSVLDLARLEREAYVGEKLHLSINPIEVVTVIRQVLDLFSLQAEQRGLALQLNAPEEPVTARLDAGALSRILTNLISNAMKFTPAGYIRATLTYQNDTLTLQIKDTGIGISEDFLPRLFSEFRRESGALPLDKEGSGLGLAITKRLVTLLGGTIEVQSRKDRGSLFTVHLPRNLHQ